jgi:DNA invertase Pin-like site-specific DNA recombinase
MDLGYARVSTREQDLTGQVTELQVAGCAKIFSEKASGARRVLVVTRLDRLARAPVHPAWP